MSVYRRVTYADRCQIYAFIAVKKRVLEIARELGFHPATIYRELKRNCCSKYRPETAEALARKRFSSCRRRKIIAGGLEAKVLEKLEERWSPEQIAARFRRENYAKLSHETIYRYIRKRPEQRLTWETNLRRHKKRGGRSRRKKRALFKWMLPIAKRPSVVDRRNRFGDWERDTMYGKGRRMILACAERKSRLVKLARAEHPVSVKLTDQTKTLLSEAGYRPLKTITNDNGGELLDGFSFDVPVYYCDPRRPQQRGTIENTIGLLRQYLPRGADLEALSFDQIKAIEHALNHRPRKCLDWRTPHEVFYGKSIALVS